MQMRARNSKRIERFRHHNYDHDQFDPPLKVLNVGVSRWVPGDAFYNKTKPMFSLNFITMGDARYTQRGRRILKAGDAILCHKGIEQLLETGPSGFMHKRVVMAEGPVLDSFFRATGLIDHDFVHPANSKKIERHLKTMYEMIQVKPSGFTLQMSVLMHDILLELARSIVPQYPAAIRAAIEYMKRNLSSNLTLKDVCSEVRLSVRHCTRLFEEHVGCSPMQFYISQRMTWGENLLKETMMSIKEIALTLGYEDPLYFSQRFRKHTGLSPKHYRKRELAKE